MQRILRTSFWRQARQCHNVGGQSTHKCTGALVRTGLSCALKNGKTWTKANRYMTMGTMGNWKKKIWGNQVRRRSRWSAKVQFKSLFCLSNSVWDLFYTGQWIATSEYARFPPHLGGACGGDLELDIPTWSSYLNRSSLCPRIVEAAGVGSDRDLAC